MASTRKGTCQAGGKAAPGHSTIMDGGKELVNFFTKNTAITKYQNGRITPTKGRAKQGIVVKIYEETHSLKVVLKKNSSVQEFHVYVDSKQPLNTVVKGIEAFALQKNFTFTLR